MGNSAKTTTLIITTYNRADALELVLLSVINQVVMPNEIIIADDGSTPETKNLVERYAKIIPVPVYHCWHEDLGFRLSKIRNRAIAMSKSDYIIMIDGDIVMHKTFIRDHIAHSHENQFIQGSRVLLSEEATAKCLLTHDIDFTPFAKGEKNRLNACVWLWLSMLISKSYGKKNIDGVRGCNMSFWKNDVIKVNGFDEDFVGWGREDSEFVVRLLNNNITRRNMKFAGAAFHLWHPERKHTELLAENQAILDEAIKSKKMVCNSGINQYL